MPLGRCQSFYQCRLILNGKLRYKLYWNLNHFFSKALQTTVVIFVATQCFELARNYIGGMITKDRRHLRVLFEPTLRHLLFITKINVLQMVLPKINRCKADGSPGWMYLSLMNYSRHIGVCVVSCLEHGMTIERHSQGTHLSLRIFRVTFSNLCI